MLQKSVYQGIQDHLDNTKSFSYQNPAAVERARQQVCSQLIKPWCVLLSLQVLAECPHLDHYVNHWPFTDMLMGTLKSSSAKWRRQQQIKAAVCERDKRQKTTEGTSEKKKRK
jgi:hypothetical protein